MSVRVRIPAQIRQVTEGTAEVAVDVDSVSKALNELEIRYPGMKGRLRDESGTLRRFVNLFVNGEDTRFLNGVDTSLKDGDELSIVAQVAGG